MSVLNIANTTKKHQSFAYRRPGSSRPNDIMILEIPPGAQRPLPFRNLSVEEIKAITDAHAKYGLVSADEVVRRQTSGYIGMCYAVDKPVLLERIQLGLQHNDAILAKLGEDIRQAAAVVTANAIEEQTGGALQTLEVSVEEDKPDQHQGAGDALGRQTVVVTREVPVDKPHKTTGSKTRPRGRG